jgi:tRNA pseudouridine55 synthase
MTAGVLVVDKPAGLTSHDVVAAARRALAERRIGHCGTLDPMATGVLALAIGSATRLVQFLSAATKHYEAVIRFGTATSTYDITGEVVAESSRRPSWSELEAALAGCRGQVMQFPPAYSAKKVGGVRAYALARRNAVETTALRPSEVTCHDLTPTFFDGDRVGLTMAVSAGFYVRSLAHDLGEALGTGAVLESLRRRRSGQFTLDSAMPFEELVRGVPDVLATAVLPLRRLLPEVPALTLSAEAATQARHGIDMPIPAGWPAPPPLVRLIDEDDQLVALAVPAKRPGFLHPSVVLG